MNFSDNFWGWAQFIFIWLLAICISYLSSDNSFFCLLILWCVYLLNMCVWEQFIFWTPVLYYIYICVYIYIHTHTCKYKILKNEPLGYTTISVSTWKSICVLTLRLAFHTLNSPFWGTGWSDAVVCCKHSYHTLHCRCPSGGGNSVS